MDDLSWMYWVSFEGLRKTDYCNEVEGFINYKLSNLRNISGGNIKCSCKKYKNKKFWFYDADVTMHLLQKRFMKKYLFWFSHGEAYIPYETTAERMLGQLLVLTTCIEL